MCTRFIWPPKQLDDDDDRCSPHGRPQASEALCVLQADSPPNLEQPGNYEQHPVHSVLLVNWLCAVALAPRGSEPGRCLSVAYVTGIEARDRATAAGWRLCRLSSSSRQRAHGARSL